MYSKEELNKLDIEQLRELSSKHWEQSKRIDLMIKYREEFGK